MRPLADGAAVPAGTREALLTFVNDVARTYRTVSNEQLVKDRRGALDDPVPADLPRAQIAATNVTKTLQGVPAAESVVKLGGYTHQLWIGQHPLIPPRLYAMIVASEPPSSPLVPVMKNVDEALMKVSGFPLAEHSELVFGNKKMIVDKQVVKIEQRDVPCVALETQPGDLVAFNHNLMHASFGGGTRRRMFTLNFCRQATTPEQVWELLGRHDNHPVG